ncbi:MAG TPA: flagellar motor protein MotA, partial [Acidobacteriaceae bacterium]|nr:flagellar motor protein MotA [Acidobacteriaceae bacterium]
MILAQLTHVVPHISNLGLLFQDQGSNVGFSLPEMWARMGIPAKAVVIILFIMSIWSLAVIIDRAIYFNAARKQSREFAPKVAGALREGKL